MNVWHVIFDMCAKFQLSSIERWKSRTPNPGSNTWRILNIPNWSLGGWGHPLQHGPSLYVILYFYAKFQLFNMIRSMSGTPRPWSHTWRRLKVPDWSLAGWGHHWYHGSSLYVILYLCAKFQLSSIIWSVSRIPCPQAYLEDIEGSWLESWWIGSSSMF